MVGEERSSNVEVDVVEVVEQENEGELRADWSYDGIERRAIFPPKGIRFEGESGTGDRFGVEMIPLEFRSYRP